MARYAVIIGLVALTVFLFGKTEVPPECQGKALCVFMVK